eukprot:GHVN01096672.1.p1 GENE.GHVN01096672.1~~GHVN01096672.1.p1  ORF type:complete len:317 (-),score=67.06 GHVN01096672.1:56-1006(-)
MWERERLVIKSLKDDFRNFDRTIQRMNKIASLRHPAAANGGANGEPQPQQDPPNTPSTSLHLSQRHPSEASNFPPFLSPEAVSLPDDSPLSSNPTHSTPSASQQKPLQTESSQKTVLHREFQGILKEFKAQHIKLNTKIAESFYPGQTNQTEQSSEKFLNRIFGEIGQLENKSEALFKSPDIKASTYINKLSDIAEEALQAAVKVHSSVVKRRNKIKRNGSQHNEKKYEEMNEEVSSAKTLSFRIRSFRSKLDGAARSETGTDSGAHRLTESLKARPSPTSQESSTLKSTHKPLPKSTQQLPQPQAPHLPQPQAPQ